MDAGTWEGSGEAVLNCKVHAERTRLVRFFSDKYLFSYNISLNPFLAFLLLILPSSPKLSIHLPYLSLSKAQSHQWSQRLRFPRHRKQQPPPPFAPAGQLGTDCGLLTELGQQLCSGPG